MKKGIYVVLIVGLLYMTYEYGRRSQVKPVEIEWPSDRAIDSLQMALDSLKSERILITTRMIGYEIENNRLRRALNGIDVPEWSAFDTSVDTGEYTLERVLSNLRNSRRYHFGDTTYWRVQRIAIRDSLVQFMRGGE